MARTPGAGARRWARRNRTAVATAVVALVALMIGLGAVTYVQVRTNVRLELANAKTKAALKQSEDSRGQAKAVNEFLSEDLLRQAEPASNAVEDHVSLLDVLDRAAEKVGVRFADQPEVEHALRHTIAETYHGLASWDKAERQWRAMLESARRRHGPESYETFEAMAMLAHILDHRGRSDAELIEMARSASEGQARLLGPGHDDTLTSRSHLASIYLHTGRVADAIELWESVLKLEESTLGADNPKTLLNRNNLGIAYDRANRLPEAIKLLESTMSLQAGKLGVDHPDTLNTRSNLGLAYQGAGRGADAVTLLEPTLKLKASKLGADNPSTLNTASILASAYHSTGRTRRPSSCSSRQSSCRNRSSAPTIPPR